MAGDFVKVTLSPLQLHSPDGGGVHSKRYELGTCITLYGRGFGYICSCEQDNGWLTTVPKESLAYLDASTMITIARIKRDYKPDRGLL